MALTDDREDPQQLLNRTRRLSGGAPQQLLQLAHSAGAAMAARFPCPPDAETSRLAGLAAVALRQYPLATLWRNRALIQFTALDWHAGVASIAMGDIFRLLEMANGIGYEERTVNLLRPAPLAIELLDGLRPIAAEPDAGFGFGPTPTLVARFISEKSGLLWLLEKDYDKARACYREAATYIADDPRGQLKVPLGAALVEYYADRTSGGDGSAAATETRRLFAGHEQGEFDFLDVAWANPDRMAEGREDLRPYELL